jgi:hypothetical protein
LKQWHRIEGKEFAAFGERSLVFAPSDGTYQIVVDDKDQDRVRVQHAGRELHWYIEIKEVCDDVYRLSGLGFGFGSFLPESFWYELLLTSPGTITYWGDRVVLREDREA